MRPARDTAGNGTPPAGASAPAGAIPFRYTLFDCDGHVVGGHVTRNPLRVEDQVTVAGLRWRVVALVGAMATVTHADSD